MYNFGKVSKDRLNTCHNDLKLIMNTTITISNIDFGIAEGYRSTEDQYKYFKEGKSKVDGITKLGKHNYKPSLAVDIYIFVDGKAVWDNEHLSYIAGIIHAVTELLFVQGKITHKIRWGGNFDMDGELLEETFDDRPHFELIN